MSGSKAVTVGYRYYLGIHMVLCHGPVDAITSIEVDGKTAWSGSNTGGRITIDNPELFGGDSREGGVSGDVDIEMGGQAQVPNDYLQARLGTDIPAYRGVVGAVLRQVYIGLNPYIKRWAFWARRINSRSDGNSTWYPAKAAIGTDMNPAHIIQECLTDTVWGMGYAFSDVDQASFMAAADQLHTEGMGMSLLWDRSQPLDEFIQIVVRHIDGSLYVNRSTGKFTLTLARGGYSVGSLPVLDESSIVRITDFKRGTLGDAVNSVTVTFTEGSTGKTNSVTVQDIALVAQQGAVVSTSIDYPGFSSTTIASKVASRDLKALSSTLARCTVYANRSAATLNVGDLFVLNWNNFGLSGVVMRVGDVELGSADSNTVKITCIEDAFSLPDLVHAAPSPSAWANPYTAPAPCPHQVLFESPYWEIAQTEGDAFAQALDPTSAFAVATGVRPSDDSINAKLYSTYGTASAYEEAGLMDFCPTCTLTSALTSNATSASVTGWVDRDLVRVGSYAIVDSEFVIVTAVSESSLTLGRGTLDTVPAPHSSGARVLFVDDFLTSDKREYGSPETVRYKILPTTTKGTLAIGSATQLSVSTTSRAYRPYPPQRVRINSVAYPPSVLGNVDIVVTWAHRDRLQQTATLIDTEATSIGPEAGTTYTAEIRTADDTLIKAYSGITGTTATFTLADLGANYGVLRVKLWAVRDGHSSLQKHDIHLERLV